VIDTVTQLLTAYAAHPTYGINTIAQGLPRNQVGGGSYPAPPDVSFWSDVDDRGVAKSLEPPKVPAVIFLGDSSAPIEIRGYNVARNITIIGAFMTDDKADPQRAVQSGGLILRAMMICFAVHFNSQDRAQGYRGLNGIEVHKVASVQEQRMNEAVGTRRIWGFLQINVHAVDTLATG
jgi:hypothetical protein